MNAKAVLFAMPTHVKGSVGKDGRKLPAHIGVRHKKVAFAVDSIQTEMQSPLDTFIAKHGGREHLCKTLADMTAEQRAKLIDAMADLGEVTHAEVMDKLGIRAPESEPDEDAAIAEHIRSQFLKLLATAVEDGVLERYEADTLESILNESGPEAAIEKLKELRDARAAVALAALGATSDGTVVEIRRPDEQVTQEDDAAVAAADTPADIGAQARADEIFAQHKEAANKAVRAAFDIEKREIRKWKIPAQMRESAEQFAQDAARFLTEWQQFCAEHGLIIED